MKKIKLFLAAIAAMVTMGVQAQLTDGTVYWIQDAGTGQFISQGANWGTQATVQEVGGLGFEAVYVSDGVYKLQNIMWNKGNNASLGLRADRFCDQASADWTLTASGDGYLVHVAGANYLCNNGDVNGDGVKRLGVTEDATAATVWKFLTKSEYDAAIQAYKDGKAATYATNLGYSSITSVSALEALITDVDQFISKDYTSSITNPTLGSNWDGWAHAAASGSNRSEGAGVGSGCAEFWNGCGAANQTVSGLPNGLYKVEFVGTFRPKNANEANNIASGETSSPAFVYANDAHVEFLHWIDVPAKANGRDGVTVANGYNNTMYTYVSDGTLKIGIVQGCWENGYMWCPFGQFRLTYYSDQVEDDDITALIATIPAEGTIPTAVYTNLASLKSSLESSKTIAAYNNLTAAIAATNALVDPYAAYKTTAEDAVIAGVAAGTINSQNTAVEEATTIEGIEACTTAIRTAIDAITTFDITSFTIKNPTAQTKDDWEGTDFGGVSDGVREYWNQQGADFHQELLNLPAGNYRLKVVALQRTGRTGTVYVDNKRTVIAQVSNSIVNLRSEAATWFAAGNGVNYVYFTISEPSNVVIGLTADAVTADYWTVWQSFALETYTESVAASYLAPGYVDAMDAAEAYLSVDMFDADKTALNTAITENTVDEASATIAAYETAIANLNAATAAAATAAANYTTYNNIVATIGENTNVDLTSFVSNGDFELNSLDGWTSEDGGNVANNGNFNNTYFVERWKNGVALGNGSLTHDAIVLPAGLYRITADAQNIEQYNNSVGGTGLFLCANEEKTEIGAKGNYSVYIKVADKTPLTIKFVQDNCTGNWISYDNVTLTYIDEDYVYALVDGKMNATVADAQTAAKDAFTGNQNGETYQALMTAIAAAQASKDAYATAGAAIANANALKDAQNFATAEAITTFADAIAAIETQYNENTLDDATAAAAGTTLGTLVTGWRAGADTPAVNYMENAFGINDFDGALYINTWSNEGESDGSNFKVPFYEYFAGDGSKLPDETWTATLTGLENGLYEVSAWVRVRTMNAETAVADLTGITMDVNGGTAIDVTEGDQVGESRFQLEEYTAEGLVKDGTLNVNFNIDAENNIHWLSFKNIKYTKVRDLLPEEEAVAPTAIALYKGEDKVTEPIALDKTNSTVTLNPVYTPADASEGYINWTSSDESVATVSSLGEVTAVLPGTATITATSILDANVSASATVTVTFPESELPANSFVNEGATRKVLTLGENLIKNGSFEYPNAYYGWTYGTGSTTPITSDKFAIETEGAADGDQYLRAKTNEGGAAAGSLNTSWPIEPGKTYVFGYKVKSTAASAGNQYIGTSLNTTKGQENSATKLANPAYGTDWTDVVYTFESGDNTWLVFNARWLANNVSFDNFYLCEAAYTLEGNVDYALDAIPTANIGTGVFQYSQDAIDAANALVQGTASVADVEAAYEAVTTLNAPDATQAYNLVFNCDGHSADGNALTLIPNPDQAQGLYGLKYLAPANVNLAQAFYFVHTTGNKYKVYAIDNDLNQRYITTQAEGYGTTWYEGIRTIDDASKAMEIEIRPNGEGLYLLWNTGANKAIAHNGTNNNDFFTNNTANFQFVETAKPSITINTTAAGWGTTILPFAVAELPEGVKAYSVNELDGKSLVFDQVTALEANKPYIIEGAWEETLTGDAQGAALSYTDGLLTGTYVDYQTVGGEYVMQKQNEKVGFFRVGTEEGDAKPWVRANRAYLTVSSEVKAFFFEDATDAIQSVFDGVAAGDIYDLAGRKVSRMQKGNVYVVNGKKVLVK